MEKLLIQQRLSLTQYFLWFFYGFFAVVFNVVNTANEILIGIVKRLV